ncbi:MAG: FecR domain-containing protein [Cytophagaceae bacterium]|nr:FecR domain-containing protein [Cytophagaceae bacterium]
MENKYADYAAEDFLNDSDFQRWVLAPTPQDRQFWADFLQRYPTHRESLAKARVLMLYFQQPEPVSPLLTQHDWQRLQDSMGGRPLRRIGWQRWVAAASVLLIALAGLGFWLTRTPGSVYETAYGQTRRITLPDGTIVSLNANSALRLNGDTREVWLTGEAFFQVKKTADHRQFKVHADQLDIVVLGTSFNVRNRREKTNVVLQEGKVRLERSRQPAMLMKPGDLVEINDRHQVSRRTVNPDNYHAWTQNRLVFEATPVSEVLQTIEDLYGVRIVAKGSFTAEKLTAILPAGKPEYVLNALAGVYNLSVSYTDTQILIQQK